MCEAAREVAAGADRAQLIDHESGQGAVLVSDALEQLMQVRAHKPSDEAGGRIAGLILRRLVRVFWRAHRGGNQAGRVPALWLSKYQVLAVS